MVLAKLVTIATMVVLVVATIAVIRQALLTDGSCSLFLQVKTIRRITAAARSSSAALWKLRKGRLQQAACQEKTERWILVKGFEQKEDCKRGRICLGLTQDDQMQGETFLLPVGCHSHLIAGSQDQDDAAYVLVSTS